MTAKLKMTSQDFENLNYARKFKTFTIIFMGQFDGLLLPFVITHAKKKKKIPLAKIDPMLNYSKMIIQIVDFPKSSKKPSMFHHHQTQHNS